MQLNRCGGAHSLGAAPLIHLARLRSLSMLALVACAALAALASPAHAQTFCEYAAIGTLTDEVINMDDQFVEPEVFTLEIGDEKICAEGKPVGLKVAACDWEQTPRVFLLDTLHGLVVRRGKMDEPAMMYVSVYCPTDADKDSGESLELPSVKKQTESLDSIPSFQSRFAELPSPGGFSSRFKDASHSKGFAPALGGRPKPGDSARAPHMPKLVAPPFLNRMLSRYSNPSYPAPSPQMPSNRSPPLLKLGPPQGSLLNNRYPMMLTRKSLSRPHHHRRNLDEDPWWPNKDELQLNWFEDSKDDRHASLMDVFQPDVHTRLASSGSPREHGSKHGAQKQRLESRSNVAQAPPKQELTPRYHFKKVVTYHSRHGEDGPQQTELQHSTSVQPSKHTTVPKLLLIIQDQDQPNPKINCRSAVENHEEPKPNYDDTSPAMPFSSDYIADEGDVLQEEESEPSPHTRGVEESPPTDALDSTHEIVGFQPDTDLVDPYSENCPPQSEYFDENHDQQQLPPNYNDKPLDFPSRDDMHPQQQNTYTTYPHRGGPPLTERPVSSSTVRNILLWKKSSGSPVTEMRISLDGTEDSLTHPWSFLSSLLMSHPAFRESTHVIRI